MGKNLHRKHLEDGFELVDRVFEEYPLIHVSQNDGQGSLLIKKGDGKIERLVERTVNSFIIEEGECVPEAKPKDYNPEKFRKSYVVYFK